ncbi:hypothetical protein [Gracilibacillus xinjiangensis]|uniref:Uncharacterized protein n=1 Tax=Gracilibacillus xinjiangensis TaxID=1193282 RepID=A0ABV8WRN1_9BACI
MGQFNSFVPMEYTVEIRVSNNKYAEPGLFDPPDEGLEGETDPEAEELDK